VIPWEETVVDAKGAQPIIGYAPRYIAETLAKDPAFPQPVYPDRRKLVWRVGDLLAWRATGGRLTLQG